MYDSGDFPELLRRARELVGLDEIRARQKARPERIGGIWASASRCTWKVPAWDRSKATVTLLPSGRVEVATGACSPGQGHRTVYAQIAADALGVPFERVDVVGGDTSNRIRRRHDREPKHGYSGQRDVRPAMKVKERALEIAADMIEAEPHDLELKTARSGSRACRGTLLTWRRSRKRAARAVLKKGAPGDGFLAETAYFSPPTVT